MIALFQHFTPLLGILGIDDLIIAAALAAAGTGLQIAASNKAASKMNEANQAELLRQKQYQARATQVANQSISDSSPKNAWKELQMGEQKRTGEYAKLGAQDLGAIQPNTASPNSVVNNPAAQRFQRGSQGVANAWSRVVGGGQARLGAGEDWGLNEKIRNQEANSKLQRIGSDAKISAGILPTEIDAASHSADAMKGWGQLVSALGSTVGLFGAVAGSAAGAGATNSAALASGGGADLGYGGAAGLGPAVNGGGFANSAWGTAF